MKIVGKSYLEGATSDAGDGLLQPVEAGDYEVSAYLSSNGGSGSGTVTLTVTWSDKYGNQTNSDLVLTIGAIAVSASITFPIHSFQGASIAYTTTVVTLPSGAEYSAYVALKDLSAPGLAV